MKLKSLCPAVESTNQSILGKGKLSFGHTLLRSVKSTHILYLPLFFFIITMLASHLGQNTSLMKSSSRSSPTYSATAFLRLGANILRLCCTGLHSRLTLRRCWMTSPSIPSISLCFQAKTSWFSCRKVVIFVFSEVESANPIFKTLDESPGTTSISYGTFNDLGIG